MAGKEEFKAAIQAGKLQEAFAMAMMNAAKLEITTWVSSHSNPQASGETGKRLRSRLHLLQNKLEHEIGETLLDSTSSSEIQQFHTRQVAESHHIIEDNLQSLQNLFQVLISLQQSHSATSSSPLVKSSSLLSSENAETELPDLADEVDDDDLVVNILEAFAVESPLEDFSNPMTPATEKEDWEDTDSNVSSETNLKLFPKEDVELDREEDVEKTSISRQETSPLTESPLEEEDEDWDDLLDLTPEDDETVYPSEADAFTPSSDLKQPSLEEEDEDWDDLLDLTPEDDETVYPSEADAFTPSSDLKQTPLEEEDEDWDDLSDLTPEDDETVYPSEEDAFTSSSETSHDSVSQSSTEEWDNWTEEDEIDSLGETPPPETPVLVDETEGESQDEDSEEWDDWDMEDSTPTIDVSHSANVDWKEDVNKNNIQTKTNPFSVEHPFSKESEEADWDELSNGEFEDYSHSLEGEENSSETRETSVFETEIVVDDETLDWDEYDIFDIKEEDLHQKNESERG